MQPTESLDDWQCLSAIREGDHAAFECLVNRHAQRYYRLAFRLLRREQDAEDVVQDAFLHLWQHPNSYDPAKATRFTTWFYRVITHRCIDRQRSWRRFLPLTEEQPDHALGADTSLGISEEQRLVEQAIARLPTRQRIAITLTFYEALSNKEAAEIMKIKVGALESLLMRAKSTLREKLHDIR